MSALAACAVTEPAPGRFPCLQPARSGRAGRGLRRCVPPEGALSGLAEAADWRAHASAAQDGAVGCGHACLCGPLLRRSLGTHSGRTRHVLGSRDGRRARGAVGKATGFLPGPHRGLRFSASLPCTCCPLGLFWKVLPPPRGGRSAYTRSPQPRVWTAPRDSNAFPSTGLGPAPVQLVQTGPVFFPRTP